MFENPGKKLKKLAEILFILSVVGSVILAFVVGFTRDRYGDLILRAGPFFLVLLGGPVLSYVEYLVLYGFGTLIEKTERTNEALERLNKTVAKLAENGPRPEKKPAPPQPPAVPAGGPASAPVRDAKRDVAPQPVTREDGKKHDPVVPQPAGEDRVACPLCGTVQRANRFLCMNCGVPFVKTED